MRPSSTFNDPKILNGPSKVFHSLVGPDLTIPAVSANYFNEAFGTFVPALVTDEARVFRSDPLPLILQKLRYRYLARAQNGSVSVIIG